MSVVVWAMGLMMVAAKPSAPAHQAAGTDRVEAIWAYAENRIDRQTDVWFDDGDFPAAIQGLRVSSELRPHDYDTVTNLGWMLENVQEWDAAQAIYEEYQRNNPQDPDRSMPIAQYFYMKRKYDRVPPLLEPAIVSGARPHPNVFRMLASSYERLGKLSDSQRVWKQYIAINNNDGQAKVNLARIEKKLAGGK